TDERADRLQVAMLGGVGDARVRSPEPRHAAGPNQKKNRQRDQRPGAGGHGRSLFRSNRRRPTGLTSPLYTSKLTARPTLSPSRGAHATRVSRGRRGPWAQP